MASGRVKYLLWGLALVAVALAVGAYARFDQILHTLVRPWLERTASEKLSAEVSIGHLAIEDASLVLTGLSIGRGRRYRLSIPRVEAAMSLSGVVGRRLEYLHVISPDVEIADSEEPSQGGFDVPSPPPLEIGELRVLQGRFLYRGQGKSFLLHGVDLESAGIARSRFRGSAYLGEGDAVPLALGGHGSWGDGLEISLQQLALADRQLLHSPLVISLSSGGEASVRGALRMDRFDSDEWRGIASALGIADPLPAGWSFHVAGLEAAVSQSEPGHSLSLRVNEARLEGERVRIPLDRAELDIGGGGALWQAEGAFRLAGAMPGRVRARYGSGTLEGHVWLTVPGSETGPQGEALLSGDFFHGGDDPLAGSVDAEGLTDDHLERLVSALGWESPLPTGWSLELVDPRAEYRLGAGGALDLKVAVPLGKVGNQRLTAPLDRLELLLSGRDDRWNGTAGFRLAGMASGSVRARYEKSTLSAQLSVNTPDAGELKRRLLGGSRLPTRGGASLRGSLEWSGDRVSIDAELTGKPSHRVDTAFLVDLSRLAARLTAEARGRAVSGHGLLLLSGREMATASGAPERLRFELFPVAWEEILSVVGPDRFPSLIEGVRGLAGAGHVVREPRGSWELEGKFGADRVSLARGSVEQLSVEGRVLPGKAGVDVADVSFSGQLALPGLPTGTVSGTGSGHLRGRRFRVQVDSLAGRDLEYLSADGMTGMSGGRVEAKGIVSGSLDDKALSLDLAADLGAREVLHRSFYADVSDVTGKLALRGEMGTDSPGVRADHLSLELGSIGRARLQGAWTPEDVWMEGAVEAPNLEGAFSRYLKAALATAYPTLESLAVSGSLAADFHLEKRGDLWQAKGVARPADLGVAWPRARIDVHGANGLIPFELTSLGSAPANREARQGEIAFAGLSLGPAVLASSPLTMNVRANRVEVLDPIVFEIAGGNVTVDRLRAALGEARPEIEATVRASGVDLKSLTEQLGMPPMAGRVAADLGQIRYADGVVGSEGEAIIEAFGGVISVRNIRFKDPLSPYPTLHGDIDFSGIDLFQLTHTFAFGEMNGIADGYVHDLRLFGWTPSQFVAEVATRERGKRNVSVKALNNLSVLSQGGLSAALSRGIYRFIDFYRYRKIGVHCTLRNDVFQLTGTARPSFDRYLIYGGVLPPKIDIIAPGRPISFKEMLKRLSRIERTGN